jgi:hypothetical protein
MHQHDDEFDRIVNQEFTDPTPYGAPAHPNKTGLTKRGKVGIAIGVTVIAGGSLIGYQMHQSNEVKAQEIALQAQALELEKLKELNRATEVDRKEQTTFDKTRQASIDKCVNSKEDKVGKGFGSPTYKEIVDVCQAQYTGGTSGDDMQAASSSSDANSSGGGGVNQGVLIGGGALVLFLVAAAKKGAKGNPA